MHITVVWLYEVDHKICAYLMYGRVSIQFMILQCVHASSTPNALVHSAINFKTRIPILVKEQQD